MKNTVVCLLAAAYGAVCQEPLIVETKWGKVEGHVNKVTGTQYFWGIPFAKPPMGELRFAPPVDPEPWSEVKRLPADVQPAECPQLHIFTDVSFGKEDCLTLDVYRPSNMTSGSKLPVMVWIYGGGFVLGADDQGNAYNGANLALKYNRIVVAMNYRVGSLGFMALDAMFAEHNTTGNYGLLDQQFGMRWVNQNIAAFGGDKDSVMIFGESAGGVSVIAQLAMPSSRPYFHAAAAESSVPVSDVSFLSYSNATRFGEFYAEKVGCPSSVGQQVQMKCLRSLTVNEVLSPLLEWRRKYPEDAQGVMTRLMPVMGYWPTVDGTVIPKPPIEQAADGTITDVPLIIGTNHDEGTTFAPLTPFIVNGGLLPVEFNKAGWERTLRHFLNETASVAVDQYYMTLPLTTYKERTEHLITDFFFACPTRMFSRALVAHPARKNPVYVYQFNQTLNSPTYNTSGDFHGSEIPYVFNLPQSNWLPEDHALSAKMSAWWASIAESGDIKCPDCPSWERYRYDVANGDNFMSLMTPTQMKKDLKKDVCDFWAKWGFYNNP